MTIHYPLVEGEFMSSVNDIAMAFGVTLEVGTDFWKYNSLVSRYRSHQPVSGAFDCRKHAFTPDSAFWVVARNGAGEVIHTQAARLVDLKGATLGDFLSEQFVQFPPAAYEIDWENSTYRPGPGARRLTGTACYHGEAWLAPDPAYRGTGLAGVLARFTKANMYLRWSPDVVFGFMAKSHAFKGLAEREGYMHSDPHCLFWHLADKTTVFKCFMVYAQRDDLEYLMEIPPQELLAA